MHLMKIEDFLKLLEGIVDTAEFMELQGTNCANSIGKQTRVSNFKPLGGSPKKQEREE